VFVITIRADKDAIVCVVDHSGARGAGTYGIGIPQAVAQIDNCACGGIDKRSSIHSISALTTFKVESA
jgi:hypothetical protein